MILLLLAHALVENKTPVDRLEPPTGGATSTAAQMLSSLSVDLRVQHWSRS